MAMSNSVGERRVLSIQSHVVHGYVGNKAATFPLQVWSTVALGLSDVHALYVGFGVRRGHCELGPVLQPHW